MARFEQIPQKLVEAGLLTLSISDAIAVTFDDIGDRIEDERSQEAERTAWLYFPPRRSMLS